MKVIIVWYGMVWCGQTSAGGPGPGLIVVFALLRTPHSLYVTPPFVKRLIWISSVQRPPKAPETAP